MNAGPFQATIAGKELTVYQSMQAELAERIHASSKTIVMMWESGLRHPSKKYRRLLNAKLGYSIYHG